MSKAELELAPDSSSIESPTYFKDATELAMLIRTKQVSSREVVQAHLDRIATVNPKINAIVTLMAEEALKGADAADNAVAATAAISVTTTNTIAVPARTA